MLFRPSSLTLSLLLSVLFSAVLLSATASPAHQRQASSICGSTCTNNTDCGGDDHVRCGLCQGGVCVHPEFCAPSASCQSDADCLPSSNSTPGGCSVCREGDCSVPQVCQYRCQTDDDCASDGVCSRCDASGQCAPPQDVQSVCGHACSADTDCQLPNGPTLCSACKFGACQFPLFCGHEGTPSADCVTDKDCEKAEKWCHVCDAGTCRAFNDPCEAACKTDADCNGDCPSCQSGFCRAASSTGGSTSGGGQQCIRDFCRTDDDCQQGCSCLEEACEGTLGGCSGEFCRSDSDCSSECSCIEQSCTATSGSSCDGEFCRDESDCAVGCDCIEEGCTSTRR